MFNGFQSKGYFWGNYQNSFKPVSSSLQLGPFCGMPACQTLKFSKGVCGAAADQKKTLLVENVHDFPGHVACDAASNSELVVPIFYQVDLGLNYAGALLKTFHFLELVVIENTELSCSLESELTFISIYSIRIPSRNRNTFEKSKFVYLSAF